MWLRSSTHHHNRDRAVPPAPGEGSGDPTLSALSGRNLVWVGLIGIQSCTRFLPVIWGRRSRGSLAALPLPPPSPTVRPRLFGRRCAERQCEQTTTLTSCAFAALFLLSRRRRSPHRAVSPVSLDEAVDPSLVLPWLSAKTYPRCWSWGFFYTPTNIQIPTNITNTKTDETNL